MRTSLTSSLFLLVAAGATTVAASGNDLSGNNLALNGSDTLFEVTQDILAMCPGASTRGISYVGGGSGVGIVQQQLNNQRVAPASRAFKSSEYCATGTATNNGAPVSTPANTEALLVGIDGVSVVANRDTTCASTNAAANGLGKASFAVGSDIYFLLSSFDVLNLLYFGLHNGTGGSLIGAYDCGSPQRRALVAAWTNLFRTDCSTGDTVCSTGLTHAWRRADVSGTADALVGILNLPSRGLGTFSTAPADVRARATEPFCNSHDANNGTTSYLDEGTPTSFSGLTYWSAGDMQDEDPIRINSNPNTNTSTTGDTVSRGQQPGRNFAGTLGLVLPIMPPDAAGISLSDAYPTATCSTVCDLFPVIKSNLIPSGFHCPDGTTPTLGKCYLPVISAAAEFPDPGCIAGNSTRCFGATGSPDGRAYNLVTVVLAEQLPTAYQQPGAYHQFALDANKRIMTGSFYRIHMRKPAPNAAPDASRGQTGVCQMGDATQQIGCLVDADRCSIGFAGREAAQDFPGTGTPPSPVFDPLKALALDEPGVALTPPFTPGANPDLALQNLLAAPGTTPFYPLARRLWFHTLFGFGDGQLMTAVNADQQSGERELTRCYNNPSITTIAVANHHYVPHTTATGATDCVDYPEESFATTQPPANVQGSGNVAFPGCALGGSGHNACTDPATAP